MIIDQIGFLSAPRLPASVQQAINDAMTAQQLVRKAQNELQVAEAEARKQIATAYGEGASDSTKKALQAAANALLNKSLSPQVLQWEALQKWDGKLPTVSSGANTPIIFSLPNK